MYSHIPHFRLLVILVASLAATLQAGCAHCTGHTNQINYNCFVDWPCFGYHSTCWRPWPEECVTCPSPYLPLPVAAEVVPAPQQPLPVEPMLQPMPPMPVAPQPPVPQPQAPQPPAPQPPAPQPAVPPQGVLPDADPASYLDVPEGLPPVTLPQESSSRRRHVEGGYSLDSLRWAPAGSR